VAAWKIGMKKHRIIRIVLIAAGFLSVFMGLIGIFLPVLPTTPFLLLAAICFANSSPRFYHWLLNNKWFGAYVRSYREGRGLPLVQKIISISLLWLLIGSSATFFVEQVWLKIILVLIAIGVTFHLSRIKTARTERKQKNIQPEERQ